MNIGIDIDGVLYPWHTSMYRHFQEFRGFEGDERAFWLYFRSLSPEAITYYVDLPLMYLDTTPTKDVLTYLPLIAELGTIYYITSRNPELKRITGKFFDIYNLPFKENVIFSKEKSTFARLLQLDVFLDDQPHNLESIKGIADIYLFKANHNWEVRDNYTVVNNMKEFYELLKGKENNAKVD